MHKSIRALGVVVLGTLVALALALQHPPSLQAQQGAFRAVSLNAATTGTGAPVNAAGREALVLYVRGTGTISSGVVTVEEADYNQVNESVYAGTWSVITTINVNQVTGGAQLAYHFPVAAYRYVRTRVTTTVAGGGSVTTVIAGH